MKNSSVLDQAAEKLLSDIREAQNRSIAIAKDASGNDITVWVLQVTNAGTDRIQGLYPSGSALTVSSPTLGDLTTAGGPITISFKRNGVDLSPLYSVYLSYATPFGKQYITFDNPCRGTYFCDGIQWTKNTNYPKDWELDPGGVVRNSWISNNNHADDNISILLKYKGLTRTINVNSNGDSYLE
jgi:hypothetical protein